MKKLLLGMVASCIILAASVIQANAQISLNLNIGNWSPPAEYAGVDYYYLPDVESYYYAPKRQFVYQESGRWVFRNSLPARYRDYRLDNGYKVAVDRPQAYKYFNDDRATYARYKGNKGGKIIHGNNGNSKWKDKGDDNYNDRGNGKWKDKGKGHGNGKGHGKH